MVTIKGQLLKKGGYTNPTAKFTKRVFIVMDITQQLPQPLPFELINDRCEIIDEFEVGDELLVQFNIRSRKWQDKEDKIRLIVILVPVRIQRIERETMI